MCYDISYSTRLESILDYLPELGLTDQLELDFESFVHVQAQAYRKYPVIIFENGEYKLKNFEWGIIADYMNTPEKIKKQRSFMCNARSEKILDDKKSYWHRIRAKRCLIPVTAIYEHREIKGWKNKVPYLVSIKDRELFCIPGLYHYSPIPDPETGEVKGTFTVITRPANSLMMKIHNGGDNAFRMPLFLQDKEMELRWLKPDLIDEQIREILNFELPSEALNYHTVWTIRGKSLRPDRQAKNAPFEWPGLPELGNDNGNVVQSLF
jgi:putative SOS response-associated peptidase YedK